MTMTNTDIERSILDLLEPSKHNGSIPVARTSVMAEVLGVEPERVSCALRRLKRRGTIDFHPALGCWHLAPN